MQKRLIKKKGENMNPVARLNIPPCPKPRMTKADRWRKRPSVLKFFAFCLYNMFRKNQKKKECWNAGRMDESSAIILYLFWQLTPARSHTPPAAVTILLY